MGTVDTCGHGENRQVTTVNPKTFIRESEARRYLWTWGKYTREQWTRRKYTGAQGKPYGTGGELDPLIVVDTGKIHR